MTQNDPNTFITSYPWSMLVGDKETVNNTRSVWTVIRSWSKFPEVICRPLDGQTVESNVTDAVFDSSGNGDTRWQQNLWTESLWAASLNTAGTGLNQMLHESVWLKHTQRWARLTFRCVCIHVLLSCHFHKRFCSVSIHMLRASYALLKLRQQPFCSDSD